MQSSQPRPPESLVSGELVQIPDEWRKEELAFRLSMHIVHRHNVVNAENQVTGSEFEIHGSAHVLTGSTAWKAPPQAVMVSFRFLASAYSMP